MISEQSARAQKMFFAYQAGEAGDSLISGHATLGPQPFTLNCQHESER